MAVKLVKANTSDHVIGAVTFDATNNVFVIMPQDGSDLIRVSIPAMERFARMIAAATMPVAVVREIRAVLDLSLQHAVLVHRTIHTVASWETKTIVTFHDVLPPVEEKKDDDLYILVKYEVDRICPVYNAFGTICTYRGYDEARRAREELERLNPGVSYEFRLLAK